MKAVRGARAPLRISSHIMASLSQALSVVLLEVQPNNSLCLWWNRASYYISDRVFWFILVPGRL